MSRLFIAELHRLLRFKQYLIECIVFIVYTICAIIFTNSSVEHSVDSFLFVIMPFIGFGSGVVVSQFIGEEYECGTFRNKLITGYTRAEIFFTQLLLHFLASFVILNFSIIVVMTGGLVRGWNYDFSSRVLFPCYLVCVGTLLFISAVSVFVSMINSSKMASFIILLVVGIGMIIIGADFYGKLKSPEWRMPYDFEIAEGQTEPVENNYYFTGELRDVLEVMLLANPYGQAIYEKELMYDKYELYKTSKVSYNPHMKILLFSAVESALLTIIGMAIFKRKNIR